MNSRDAAAAAPTPVAWPARRVVLMGVSGCGKTTVGQLLAQRMGWAFIEGDAEHSAHNVAKMAAGQALSDDDRADWLLRLSQRLRASTGRGAGVVMSCSALKRAYRDVLRQGDPDLLFVHLNGPADLVATRLATRQGHYMPASLLQSQLDDLQAPAADEQALSLPLADTPERIVQRIASDLQSHQPQHSLAA